jgi:sporulation protein YlmC with PRC-barrel domain
MISETQIQQVIGTTAVDADGDKIGKISEIYLDDETGRPVRHQGDLRAAGPGRPLR